MLNANIFVKANEVIGWNVFHWSGKTMCTRIFCSRYRRLSSASVKMSAVYAWNLKFRLKKLERNYLTMGRYFIMAGRQKTSSEQQQHQNHAVAWNRSRSTRSLLGCFPSPVVFSFKGSENKRCLIEFLSSSKDLTAQVCVAWHSFHLAKLNHFTH